ncbi:hypothetical protein RB614_09065 [Phytohabitans sp. ZYX-F-186]|uniref:Uncharacterized protein n=1 Tax=Phytohabitans maris TaxID=3071409 RepID=A0ABU0ZC81_9ACTN|nr:hypothetical protein [Phytohabitans sp. ZYX-F-186]MDQ7904669.1 hypothetical protein [Phytohabitans sp. ZYX-F-186]
MIKLATAGQLCVAVLDGIRVTNAEAGGSGTPSGMGGEPHAVIASTSTTTAITGSIRPARPSHRGSVRLPHTATAAKSHPTTLKQSPA